MRILVVGGGGREHALCWALRRDLPDATLLAAPGNPGTAQLGTNLPIAATAVDDLVRAATDQRIDLVVVGPEAPLAAGLVDRLRVAGRAAFGPTRAAARLEWSKAFAKDVMRKADVPTAASREFGNFADARAYIAGAHSERLVVKASGLAAGKGVVVCDTRADAERAARAMLEGDAFGDAGREIVVEELLEGEELSVMALTDGQQIAILPPAQDHKRLLEGDAGPNTGGMGAYCPVSITTPALLARVRREVFEPVLWEMQARDTVYQGVLYAGLMIAPDGTPKVLEFNCRLGDPEAQVILPVLPRGAMTDLAAIARGEWRPAADAIAPTGTAVTTVLAARGYPEKPELGAAITLPSGLGPDVLVFHAGTATGEGGALRVAGGRVLAVTALGRSVKEAAEKSAAACARIEFAGKTFRRDIGWREIARAGAA
ncbi:MAG TPA: phosphoribosylamine--glycine ligase [Gemmatimonadales bacterium]|nr:phosphoribosylamine--glycine ligase [Gemmatimonadales bacterium]